jgi:glycine/serine hydroxymethyltransferase
MEQIAAWIDQVLTCPDGEQEKTTATVAGAVGELCSQYPVPNSSY